MSKNMYSLYFSDQLKKLSYEALESGEILNTLAITIRDNDTFMLDSVAPSCENVICNLQKCLDQIKKELDV